MPPTPPSQRELQALKVLWHLGQASVRDVCDGINREGAELAYTTVLSLLQVMERKGLIGHVAQGKTYAYFAKVDREATLRDLAQGFLATVFDGALDEYLVHAIQGRPPSAGELDRLEQQIAAARERLGSEKGETP
ncbi:MAG: BlaI/MecI/CopY family transcriptional regulator [Pirellulaceae bacterium]|nr:BlaI/MecI/CopY family transcriptional regulator [Pirellulaceae bacterium]